MCTPPCWEQAPCLVLAAEYVPSAHCAVALLGLDAAVAEPSESSAAIDAAEISLKKRMAESSIKLNTPEGGQESRRYCTTHCAARYPSSGKDVSDGHRLRRAPHRHRRERLRRRGHPAFDREKRRRRHRKARPPRERARCRD